MIWCAFFSVSVSSPTYDGDATVPGTDDGGSLRKQVPPGANYPRSNGKAFQSTKGRCKHYILTLYKTIKRCPFKLLEIW